MISEEEYGARVRAEDEHFRDINVHELPEIFHYWSEFYLWPTLNSVFEEFAPGGQTSVAGIYAASLSQAMQRTGNNTVVSLGSGDASLEISVAKLLRDMGRGEFTIELVEMSDALGARTIAAVEQAGLQDNLAWVRADANKWRPSYGYAGVIANHSLHHFLDLEHVFLSIDDALEDDGAFVSFDMIGRNGHMRWPEVRIVVQHFWNSLPEHYRYHHQLQRLESPLFQDWDCSSEGFEGIRAQDILPLLAGRFDFSHFAAWGGVSDVFLDRGFGHNFSPKRQEDRDFIDRVAAAEASLQDIGFIKPTQMAAVMRKRGKAAGCRYWKNLKPKAAIRDPNLLL